MNEGMSLSAQGAGAILLSPELQVGIVWQIVTVAPHLLWWGVWIVFPHFLSSSSADTRLTLFVEACQSSQSLVIILLLDLPFNCRWQCLSQTWRIIGHGVINRDCRLEILPGKCHLVLEVSLWHRKWADDTAVTLASVCRDVNSGWFSPPILWWR